MSTPYPPDPPVGDDVEEGYLVVQTQPTEGARADFEAWYDGNHLAEILEIKGFKSAERLRLDPRPDIVGDWSSDLVIYHVVADDLSAAMSALQQRIVDGTLRSHKTVQPPVRQALYRLITRRTELNGDDGNE